MGKSTDITAYIDSGVLELYVAGVLSTEESAEVTAMAQAHPRLAAEIEAIEQSMQLYATSFTDTSAEDNERTITAALAQIDEEASQSASPAASVGPSVSAENIFPLHKSPKRRFHPWQLAATILLLMSVGANLWLFFKWQDTDSRLNTLISQRDQLAEDRQETLTRFDEASDMLAHLRAPVSQRVFLNGTNLSTESELQVVWNPHSQELLAYGLDRLPAPPDDKQYQLWAIVDGVPIDAGVLTYQDGPQWVKRVQGSPAAFAVTLEPVGGSANPTLDQMYVVGEVG